MTDRSALTVATECHRCDCPTTLVLALPCDRCGGGGLIENPHWEEERSPEEIPCPTCLGHGLVPTATGRAILDLAQLGPIGPIGPIAPSTAIDHAPAVSTLGECIRCGDVIFHDEDSCGCPYGPVLERDLVSVPFARGKPVVLQVFDGHASRITDVAALSAEYPDPDYIIRSAQRWTPVVFGVRAPFTMIIVKPRIQACPVCGGTGDVITAREKREQCLSCRAKGFVRLH